MSVIKDQTPYSIVLVIPLKNLTDAIPGMGGGGGGLWRKGVNLSHINFDFFLSSSLNHASVDSDCEITV